jgi:hypothetical protein
MNELLRKLNTRIDDCLSQLSEHDRREFLCTLHGDLGLRIVALHAEQREAQEHKLKHFHTSSMKPAGYKFI